jgi:signal transduction histidine kinase
VKSNGAVRLVVRDHGPGIPKEHLPRIFERFYRGGEELTRSTGGSGIGLTLVKKIVESHNGYITVDSKLGHGTLFTVSIPVKEQGHA